MYATTFVLAGVWIVSDMRRIVPCYFAVVTCLVLDGPDITSWLKQTAHDIVHCRDGR